MAGLSYSLAFGHKGIKSDKNYEILLNSIRSNELDFSHKNKLWQCLFWTSEEREKHFPGIGEVLYVAGDYLPDRGLYDQENQVVRFGARHSDLYPKIGDMIRYALGFPARPSIKRAKI